MGMFTFTCLPTVPLEVLFFATLLDGGTFATLDGETFATLDERVTVDRELLSLGEHITRIVKKIMNKMSISAYDTPLNKLIDQTMKIKSCFIPANYHWIFFATTKKSAIKYTSTHYATPNLTKQINENTTHVLTFLLFPFRDHFSLVYALQNKIFITAVPMWL